MSLGCLVPLLGPPLDLLGSPVEDPPPPAPHPPGEALLHSPPFLEPGLTSSPPGRTQLSSCSEPQVSQFIRKHVASCLLVSDTSTELSYILPSEAAKKGAFERLFQVWGGVSSRAGRGGGGARRGGVVVVVVEWAPGQGAEGAVPAAPGHALPFPSIWSAVWTLCT